MPNRILKESICTSEEIDKLTWFEEVLFYRLMISCDDFGRFDGRPLIIKNRLFPLKENVTAKSVFNAINRLSTVGLVALYEFESKPYLQLTTWDKHQQIRAKKSKYPEPAERKSDPQAIDINCNQMISNDIKCYRNPIQSKSNPNQNPNINVPTGTKRFQKPTIEEIEAYCLENHYQINASYFHDYYESNGWCVGKKPMRDWRAAVRNWSRMDRERSKKSESRSNNPFLDLMREGDAGIEP